MATHLLSAFAFSRRRGVRLYTVVLAIVCCHSFSAQAQPVRFQTVSIDAGKPITDNYLEVKENNLPITNVLCLYQSGDGTIWMATHSDGLISYRGNYLKHYRHEPGNPGSLPNNAVTEVWEESPTVLWLSTGSGLVKYNRLVDSFSLFSTKGRYVRKGPDGRLYTTVPELGMHIIDTIQQRIVRLPGQRIFGEDGKPVGMETMAYIKKFAFDNDGVIWATAKSKTTEGLYHLDSKNNRWIFHPPPTMYMPDAEKKED
ncbi:MAG TPA: two-component regulator propeller domain-containing protein [Flavisolibacter sp.]|nr:two-component regulator propeller domain-containing protein [Flavisolibacter sp.]